MTTPARVIITPYLNNRAFVTLGAPSGFVLQAMPPRDACEALARGDALAGVVPVGGLAALGERVEMLGSYGIAAFGPVQSVLCFSARPFAELDERCTIKLSQESMSSVRLLFLLLAERKPQIGLPRVARAGERVTAEVVIGDAALRARHARPFPHVTDLAEAWAAHTGLPMVFARWVIRRGAARAVRTRLLWWLAAYCANELSLIELTAARDCAQGALTPGAAVAYLRGMRTQLGAAELRGQQRYTAELDARPWLDSVLTQPTATYELRR